MKKSKKGIIAAVIVIIAAVLGISGAFNDSEDKSDYDTTTFEERIIIFDVNIISIKLSRV